MFGNIPFVRYLIFLLTGIFCGEYLLKDVLSVEFLLRFSLVAVIALSISVLVFNRGVRSLLLFCFLLLGIWTSIRQSRDLAEALQEVENADYEYYQIKVIGLPEKRTKSLRYEAEVERLISDAVSTPVFSRAFIYFPPTMIKLPQVGEKVVIKGKLQRPPPATSEFSFDYRRYLERKGILWTGYANKDSRIIPVAGGRTFREILLQFSEMADGLFSNYIKDDRAYGLVKAMILGRRDGIDPGLNAAFINSGTVHILSVSGLHIAIFFSVLHFLFSPLCKSRWGRIIYLTLITLVLVSYAVITGLPASVQRATFMCIVWMLANTFGRRQSGINTLALSAFVILLADPAAFYDIGFQLSFLAMLGIFLLYEPLLSFYEPEGRLPRHLWSVSILSIAAQLMTFPLVTFYFHQFPSYFLVANILAVDLAGLLIPVSMIFLLSGFLGLEWMTVLAGWLLNQLARLVNFIVEIPQSLPHFLLSDLYLDRIQMLLLLGILLVGYSMYRSRAREWIYYFTAIAAGFCLYSSWMLMHDYGERLVTSLDEGRIVLLKSSGRTLIFDAANSHSDPFVARDLKEYVARHGADTLVISLNGVD